jgi:hypothetical protein
MYFRTKSRGASATRTGSNKRASAERTNASDLRGQRRTKTKEKISHSSGNSKEWILAEQASAGRFYLRARRRVASDQARGSGEARRTDAMQGREGEVDFAVRRGGGRRRG